ncbi:hypothetical protein EZH22_21360 [Xanthobacter dioxanivorans]|uniref:Uncharacterized protein n=1 Tax=Xanthobacter dioxanivorans TaxID=2528964 RepID=A0A974SIQ3_9HYPH|nr:hypothetical protein [Xanthobacter dioxanivorans]QRG05588.1 hypothetical protein EZH22_21360 [Xanthobacter dioxanivorans]
MARFWNSDLHHPIWLHDGTWLATLGDCGRHLLQRFAQGDGGPQLNSALKALLEAAQAGRPEDIAFAESHVRRFFHAKAML